jgi:hypothetical protein
MTAVANVQKIETTVPFMSRYTVLNLEPIKTKDKLASIDGLLALFIAEGELVREVTAYWKSRDHFAKGRQELENKLRPLTDDGGLLLELLVAPKRWYEWLTPQNIWTGIATIVAIVGTLEALRNDYSWLLGKPKIRFVEDEKQKNFSVTEPIVIDRQYVNTGRCNARIEIKSEGVVELDGSEATGNQLELSKELPEIAELEPNKAGTFPIRAIGHIAGIYEIQYRGRLENGWLGKSAWKGLNQKVRIWVDFSLVPDSNMIRPEGRVCYVSGLLQAGHSAEKGVDCDAWLGGEPGIKIERAQMKELISQKSADPPIGDPSLTVTKLKWSTSPLEKFHDYDFTIVLSSDADRTDWIDICGRLKFHARLTR